MDYQRDKRGNILKDKHGSSLPMVQTGTWTKLTIEESKEDAMGAKTWWWVDSSSQPSANGLWYKNTLLFQLLSEIYASEINPKQGCKCGGSGSAGEPAGFTWRS